MLTEEQITEIRQRSEAEIEARERWRRAFPEPTNEEKELDQRIEDVCALLDTISAMNAQIERLLDIMECADALCAYLERDPDWADCRVVKTLRKAIHAEHAHLHNPDYVEDGHDP